MQSSLPSSHSPMLQQIPPWRQALSRAGLCCSQSPGRGTRQQGSPAAPEPKGSTAWRAALTPATQQGITMLLCFTFELGHHTHDQLAHLKEVLNGPLQPWGNQLRHRGLCCLTAEWETTQRSSDPSSQQAQWARRETGKTPYSNRSQGGCVPAISTGTSS